MLNTKNVSEIKAEAVPYEGVVRDIDEMIELIEKYKAEGKNYSFEFHGKKFYSLLDDEESCYKEITGMAKKEYLEVEKKFFAERADQNEKEEKEAKANIPAWVKEGEEMIYPQRCTEWESFVKDDAKGLYRGNYVKDVVAIMRLLDSGAPFEQVRDAFVKLDCNPHHMYEITKFSKKGPEFYRFVNKQLTEETGEFLEKIEDENKEFAKELESKQPGSED